jgi:glycosyltransferase involved in cell wall biosynthesis
MVTFGVQKMSRNKTVVIYYGGFLSKSGGAFMHAATLDAAFISLGYTSSIITLDKLPPLIRYLPHVGLKIANIIRPPFGFFLKGKIISLLYRIFFPERNSDIVIFEDIYLPWHTSVPSLAILHAVWSDNLEGLSFSKSSIARLKSSELSVLRSLPCPISVVSFEYSEYLRLKHFRGERLPKMHCIPLGLDVQMIKSYRNDSASLCPKSLVFCGVCVERKNLIFLIDVLEKLCKISSGYSLTIIGDGPQAPILKSLVSTKCLPVSFVGRLHGSDLFTELSSHSILVHTSTKESFSFALLEAKILGLKTVAYHGLEVPPEFIDFKVKDFCVNSWVELIVQAVASKSVDRDFSRYSSLTMAKRTVELAS